MEEMAASTTKYYYACLIGTSTVLANMRFSTISAIVPLAFALLAASSPLPQDGADTEGSSLPPPYIHLANSV